MTQGEKVDELTKLTAVLEERLKNVQSQLKEFGDTLSEVDKSLRSVQEKFAIVEDQVKELRGNVKESASKRWTLVSSILTAFIAVVLTLLSQVLLAYLSLKK